MDSDQNPATGHVETGCRAVNSSLPQLGRGALRFAASLRRLLEISQVGWLLIPLGRHQQAVRAQKIVLLSDHDIHVALVATGFRPSRTRIRVAPKCLVDAPGSRQSVIEHRDLIVKQVWIVLVEKEPLPEG